MSGLLSGLSKLGLADLEELEVFKPEETGNVEKEETVVKMQPEEASFLFDRKYVCPVCGSAVKSKAVRNGRVKTVGTDIDLRPKYEQLDTLKYDIVACRICGYAALTRNFASITDNQVALVQNKIGANFKSQAEFEGSSYSYDDALERYKLALACSVVKQDKTSERAYLCLKTAWVVRGKREMLEALLAETKASGQKLRKEDAERVSQIPELVKEEKVYLKNALEGFLGARRMETFPMCGMDELTVDYLIAALATVFEQYDVARKLLGNILVSRVANVRLKDKARDLKEMIAKVTKSE